MYTKIESKNYFTEWVSGENSTFSKIRSIEKGKIEPYTWWMELRGTINKGGKTPTMFSCRNKIRITLLKYVLP